MKLKKPEQECKQLLIFYLFFLVGGGGGWLGKTRKNYLKSVYVCVFSENILIFLERKDKAVIVKQNIHD